ncbi:MAG: S8 family serine peptidase [Muribaculaceae bacterium]
MIRRFAHIIILVALLPVALSAASSGRNVLSARSQCRLAAKEFVAEDAMLPCFVSVDADSVYSLLLDMGVEVNHRFGNVATVMIPRNALQRVSNLAHVKSVQLAQTLSVDNDHARAMTHVDEVHNAQGLTMPFTGKDVVLGMVDVGIDFNHAAFADADGNNRVKAVYLPSDNSGDAPEVDGNKLPGSFFDTPQSIAALQADCDNESHGTHTTNTAAGRNLGNPYYGVAPDAQLVLCAMPEEQLTDVNIANSLAFIFDYARKAGLPAVVNMSLSSTSGPHDGTSMLSQVISNVTGEGRLCVLSVGNDAQQRTRLTMQFNADDDIKNTFFENYYARNSVLGCCDVWSSNQEPFKVQFVFYDRRSKSIVSSTPWYEVGDGDDNNAVIINVADCEVVDNVFVGNIAFASCIGDNGKAEIYTEFNVQCGSDADEASNYYMGMRFCAREGVELNAWTNRGTLMVSNGISGWIGGKPDGNISDLTTGEGAISVGAYCSKTTVQQIEGVGQYDKNVEGDMAFFSSYGKDMNGISRPTVTAPGYAVVSAMNRYDKTIETNEMALLSVTDGSNYYWGAKYGTSQSAPVVTGTLAMWLQANSSLTPEQAIEVMQNTSRRDDFVLSGNAEQWGCGKIDALQGLQYLLGGGSGIDDVSNRLWQVAVCGGMVVIMAPCNGKARLRVYDLAGAEVFAADCVIDGGVARVPIDVTHGAYVLTVSMEHASHAMKMIF